MNDTMHLIDAGELGRILGISRGSVYRRRSVGQPLPRSITIGSLVRWRPEDVEEFLREHLETTQPQRKENK